MNTSSKNNTNEKKKAVRKSILSVLLIIAILVAGAFAFLTASDSKTNVFTVGKVKVELWEKFDTDLDGEVETYDTTCKNPPAVNNIVPGKKVAKKPYVVNNGNSDAWVFMAVGIPTSNNIYRSSEKEQAALALTTQNVEVKSFALQGNYKNLTSMNDVASEYFNTAVFENAYGQGFINNSETELFTFTGIDPETYQSNNSAWTFIPANYIDDEGISHDAFEVAGMKYYLYGYNTKLAAGQTTEENPLFTEAILNRNIGSIGKNPSTGSSKMLPETINDIDLSKCVIIINGYNEGDFHIYTTIDDAELFEALEAEPSMVETELPYATTEEMFDSIEGFTMISPETNLAIEIWNEDKDPDGWDVEVYPFFEDVSITDIDISSNTVLGLTIDYLRVDIYDTQNTNLKLSEFDENTYIAIFFQEAPTDGYNENLFDNCDVAKLNLCHSHGAKDAEGMAFDSMIRAFGAKYGSMISFYDNVNYPAGYDK